jgi:uncharacterized membrane protein YhaH (DUF805 family)
MRPDLLSRLFSLSGRLNVPEAFILQMLLGWLGYLLVWALTRDAGWQREIEMRMAGEAAVGLGTLFLLTKRLHDHGWSGWWALLSLPLIPLGVYRSWRVTALNPEVLTGHDPWWYVPASVVSVPILVVVLGVFFIPGSSNDNRFGPSPRRARDESVHNA